MRSLGVVLTHVESIATLYRTIRHYQFGGLIVVGGPSGWGLPSGWTDDSIARIIGMTTHTYVRTTEGDPSSAQSGVPGRSPYPHRESILDALRPWAYYQPHVTCILGNEPNMGAVSGAFSDFCYGYRWHLINTIQAIRTTYPDMTIVSPAPALMPDANGKLNQKGIQFIEICRDALRMCDLIGLHMYGYFSFLEPHVHQIFDLYRIHFGDKSWTITELGIDDAQTSSTTKLEQYWRFVEQAPSQVTGAAAFHINQDSEWKNYAIPVHR